MFQKSKNKIFTGIFLGMLAAVNAMAHPGHEVMTTGDSGSGILHYLTHPQHGFLILIFMAVLLLLGYSRLQSKR